jgi:hypothetical protein
MKYKSKKNQVKALLGYQVNLAQMKLEDGITVIEAEQFEPEYSVGIVTADGLVAMPVGEYVLEDGKILVVEVEGIIKEVKEAEAEAEAEVEVEVEVAPEEVVEPEMNAQPSAPAPQAKRIVESVSKETFFEEIEKIRAEFASQIEELKAVKVELKSAKLELEEMPAAEPIAYNPEAESKSAMINFAQNRPESIQDKVFQRMFK